MAETLSVSEMLPQKYEPLVKRRFVFAVEGIDSFLIKTAARPSYTTEEVAIPWVNSTRYLAGKTTFETLELTLHEAISPSTSQQAMEWMRLCWESVSGRSGYADFYKRDVQIKMLDPVGTVVSLWDLKGAFITNLNFGDLTYEGSDMTEVSVTIRYDQAVLQF